MTRTDLKNTPRSTESPVPAVPSALLDALLRVIDDAKAEEIVTLDLAGKTALADAMIVASGGSARHVGAIADRIIVALKEMGHPTPRVEGMPVCDWVLIDAQDVIIHLFRPEVRLFYNLEKLWGVGRPQEGAQPESGADKPKRPRKVSSAPAEGAAPARRRTAPRARPGSGRA